MPDGPLGPPPGASVTAWRIPMDPTENLPEAFAADGNMQPFDAVLHTTLPPLTQIPRQSSPTEPSPPEPTKNKKLTWFATCANGENCKGGPKRCER